MYSLRFLKTIWILIVLSLLACANESDPSIPKSDTSPTPEFVIVPVPADDIEEGIEKHIEVPQFRNNDAYDEK